MGHQYRLGNQQNEGNNRVRDARALRYSLASNSTDNSSTFGFNNRNNGGSRRITADQSVYELITHAFRHGTTNGGVHPYPSPLLLPTTINITNYNENHSSSPSSPPAPRLFGSTLANMSPSSPLGGVAGSAAAYDNNNHNGGVAATTATGAPITRDDDSLRSFSSKRSRSPDQFSRGESSGQGSQDAGTSTRRRTIPHNMSSSTSTPWRNYSSRSVIPNMFDHQMMNQATAGGAGPSLLEDDSPTTFLDLPYPYPYDSNSTYNESSDINHSLFSPRQNYQPNNFTSRRYDPPFVSASALSFHTSAAATGGSLGTTQVPTPFDRYNNFMSSSAAGGSSSSSFSYSRGTSGGENENTNNNNNDSLDDRIEREVAALDQTINVRRYITVLPSGHINQFVAPTLVPVRSGTLVPPLPQVRARRGHINRIFISNSRELRAERNRLRDEINSCIQYLRNGGSMRTEDLLILDYSIVLNLLDSQERIDQLNGTADWPFELIADMEARFGGINEGLTEEEILAFIRQETFQTRLGETSTQDQTCTICQEDYVDGEQIGRIDCMHIYHLDCIKQWLKEKNSCPICKHTALDIDGDDD